jgi:hypothetical protein
MSSAIVVLNAGSSSLKFSLFASRDGELEIDVRGQIQEIDTAPHFIATRHNGAPTAEKSWPRAPGLAMMARSTICSRSYAPSSRRTTWWASGIGSFTEAWSIRSRWSSTAA